MKAIKGFILFCFLGSVISACFDAPDFSNTPEISYKNIQFNEATASGDSSALVLTLNFKDGDGDLGLDPFNPDDFKYPYNDVFYYLAAGPTLDDTIRVGTSQLRIDQNNIFVVLDSIDDNTITGRLVTDQLRNTSGFENLPVYDPSSKCLNYSLTTVLVPESFDAVDETFNILDTIDHNGKRYFKVEEPLLFKFNPNHYNIDVEFWTLESNGLFKMYDWSAIICGLGFNGRFPLLGKGTRPLEGTIRYAMESNSFLAIFSVKTIKLRVKIRDRSNKTSNIIETPPFRLSDI